MKLFGRFFSDSPYVFNERKGVRLSLLWLLKDRWDSGFGFWVDGIVSSWLMGDG
jgi:hypothetical protein